MEAFSASYALRNPLAQQILTGTSGCHSIIRVRGPDRSLSDLRNEPTPIAMILNGTLLGGVTLYTSHAATGHVPKLLNLNPA